LAEDRVFAGTAVDLVVAGAAVDRVAVRVAVAREVGRLEGVIARVAVDQVMPLRVDDRVIATSPANVVVAVVAVEDVIARTAGDRIVVVAPVNEVPTCTGLDEVPAGTPVDAERGSRQVEDLVVAPAPGDLKGAVHLELEPADVHGRGVAGQLNSVRPLLQL